MIKDRIPLGMALPNRSTEPLDPATVSAVARRAEDLGFHDLWVTENMLGRSFAVDPLIALTFAAAVTSTIRLGAAVVVLPTHHPIHVAHQVASLDQLSGGRAILGVGIGRDQHYREFQIPPERKVRRFREGIELLRALWGEPEVTFKGEFFQLDGARLSVRPRQSPIPIWVGGEHPDAILRAARLGDGWIGGGSGGSIAGFGAQVRSLRGALEQYGRDPSTFPISKRLFVAVDSDATVAKGMLERWFGQVYRDPRLTDSHGICGTPEQVREQIESLIDVGADHLLLNPVERFSEQLEALAAVASLR